MILIDSLPLGVITFSTNHDTSETLRRMIYPSTTTSSSSSESQPTTATTITTSPSQQSRSPLRILLETDAPYMIPANIYPSLYAEPPAGKGMKSNTRLPLSHCGMVPWTAGWVAEYLNSHDPAVAEEKGEAVGNGEVSGNEDGQEKEKVGEGESGEHGEEGDVWTAESVMKISRENARMVYGI
jgi:hypothetical protein